jgi:hypothetical protein
MAPAQTGQTKSNQIKPKYWDSLLQSAADQTYIGRSKSVLGSPGQSQRKNFIKPTRQNPKIIGQTNKNSPKKHPKEPAKNLHKSNLQEYLASADGPLPMALPSPAAHPHLWPSAVVAVCNGGRPRGPHFILLEAVN